MKGRRAVPAWCSTTVQCTGKPRRAGSVRLSKLVRAGFSGDRGVRRLVVLLACLSVASPCVAVVAGRPTAADSALAGWLITDHAETFVALLAVWATYELALIAKRARRSQ